MALNKSVATTARLLIVCNLPDLPTSLVVPLDVPGIERPLPARALRRARSEHQHILNRHVIVRPLAARLGLVFCGDVVLSAGPRRHSDLSWSTSARLLIVCTLPDLPTSLVLPLDVPGIERPLPARALRRARSEHQHILNRQVIVRRLAARLGLVFRGDVVLAAGQRRHFE